MGTPLGSSDGWACIGGLMGGYGLLLPSGLQSPERAEWISRNDRVDETQANRGESTTTRKGEEERVKSATGFVWRQGKESIVKGTTQTKRRKKTSISGQCRGLSGEQGSDGS